MNTEDHVLGRTVAPGQTCASQTSKAGLVRDLAGRSQSGLLQPDLETGLGLCLASALALGTQI